MVEGACGKQEVFLSMWLLVLILRGLSLSHLTVTAPSRREPLRNAVTTTEPQKRTPTLRESEKII